MAQLAERLLGKEQVEGSNPSRGCTPLTDPRVGAQSWFGLSGGGPPGGERTRSSGAPPEGMHPRAPHRPYARYDGGPARLPVTLTVSGVAPQDEMTGASSIVAGVVVRFLGVTRRRMSIDQAERVRGPHLHGSGPAPFEAREARPAGPIAGLTLAAYRTARRTSRRQRWGIRTRGSTVPPPPG